MAYFTFLQQSHRPIRRNGFTLLELIVVLVILIVLVALFFPVFSRVNPPGNRVICASNLKQVGLAIMQYTQDYNDLYPANLAGLRKTGILQPNDEYPGARFDVALESGLVGHYQTWMDLIYPYARGTHLFTCSQDDRKNSPYPSYGYSVALGGYDAARSRFGKGKQQFLSTGMGEVVAPAQVIMSADYHAPESYRMTPNDLQHNAAIPGNTVVSPHLDGGTILYADGHVKWQNRKLLSHFATGTDACNLKKPDKNSQYCEKAFNPFLS